ASSCASTAVLYVYGGGHMSTSAICASYFLVSISSACARPGQVLHDSAVRLSDVSVRYGCFHAGCGLAALLVLGLDVRAGDGHVLPATLADGMDVQHRLPVLAIAHAEHVGLQALARLHAVGAENGVDGCLDGRPGLLGVHEAQPRADAANDAPFVVAPVHPVILARILSAVLQLGEGERSSDALGGRVEQATGLVDRTHDCTRSGGPAGVAQLVAEVSEVGRVRPSQSAGARIAVMVERAAAARPEAPSWWPR